jgi:hypothetical protein
MTSKLKLVLIAALAAVSLASPTLAQTTTQHSSGKTHHERSLRSGNLFDRAPGGPGSTFNEGNQSPDPTAGAGDY